MPGTQLEARHTKQWQDIGFQGKDPATDFRGMGVLGLYCLQYPPLSPSLSFPLSSFYCLNRHTQLRVVDVVFNVCLLRTSFKVDRCVIQLAKYYFLSKMRVCSLTSSSFLPLSINFLFSQQKLLCHSSPVGGSFSSLSLSPPTTPVSCPTTSLRSFAHLSIPATTALPFRIYIFTLVQQTRVILTNIL